MKYLGPEQRGSVGGQTASRNTYGQYYRARAGGGGSGASWWAAGVAQWRAFSEPERDAWRAFAVGQPVRNSLGVVVALTGFDAWMRAYAYRQLVGPLRTAPPDRGTSVVTELTGMALFAGIPSLYWLASDLDTYNLATVYFCYPVLPGQRYLPPRGTYWRKLPFVTNVSTGGPGPDFYTVGVFFPGGFGFTPTSGSLIGFRMRTLWDGAWPIADVEAIVTWP